MIVGRLYGGMPCVNEIDSVLVWRHICPICMPMSRSQEEEQEGMVVMMVMVVLG